MLYQVVMATLEGREQVVNCQFFTNKRRIKNMLEMKTEMTALKDK
jgi:hypothetical protein